MAWENNAVANIDMATNTLDIWGWIAFFTETEGTVGYTIDGGDVVYNASFTYTAEIGVQDHIAANVPGALSACRMEFSIPVATLAAGEHTFALVAKDPAGNEEVIKEFKVIKTVPYVDKSEAGFIEWSFDGFYANDSLYFAEDGNAASKLEAQNKIVPVAYGTTYNTIGFRGWTSFEQTAEAFGYFISGVNTEIVYGEFLQERPDLVAANKKNGCGFNISVPTADLSYGSYNVSIYVKLADGTIAKLYDITLDVLNLVVDTESKFMCSIDHVNGSGPVKADGSYDPHFNAIGGLSMGKIDAGVAGKTNDADGIVTLGGWIGVSGGVNRFVWSVDGVNWFDVVSGGKDGEPLEGHYNSLNTEEGMTSTKNGMFTSGSFITIQLPKAYVGATGTIYVGAIPELNQGTVIIFCELSNFTVSEIVSADEPETPDEPAAPVYNGQWHASVDSFMYCVNDDFSDVVTFAQAATNKNNGTTIANASGSLASVNAKYVYFDNGWLAVDGYALENWVCNVYAADGALLKTVNLTLRDAEPGVVDHVANNMKYGEGTVSNRVGQIAEEVISLADFAGQTVKVVYSVDAGEYTINMIELNVIVP